MKWFEFFLVILISFILSFVDLRFFFGGLIDYQINKSARKKRRQGMTFKEWLFYLRFRNEIPKVLLILYFTVLIVIYISLSCPNLLGGLPMDNHNRTPFLEAFSRV